MKIKTFEENKEENIDENINENVSINPELLEDVKTIADRNDMYGTLAKFCLSLAGIEVEI